MPQVRLGRWLLWAGALVTSAAALRLVLWYWPGAVPLDVTSGVWTALGSDAAAGVLYRPLLGPAGYGGTRYMPLFFVAHGALMRLGLDPVSAGVALTAASALLFDVALYLALRELEVRRSLALPLSVLGHATLSVQLLTLGTRCDLLASALNLVAVTSALRCVRRPRRTTLALTVVSLAAALFTKFTTVSGAIAALALIRLRRGWRDAAAAAVGLGLLLATAAIAVDAASEGRAWASMRAVGSGGINAGYAARFPLWFALTVAEDPFLLLVLLCSLFYAIRLTRRDGLTFAPAYFWLTLAVTVPVFASPGTDNNHLIDLLGASVLVLGDVLERHAASARLAAALPAVLAGLTVVSWLPGMVSIRSVIEQRGRPERRTIAAILRGSGPGDRILSENPLVPLLGGTRPFVSDPFSLRILAATKPAVRADFERRLAAGEFPIVVLVDWSGADAGHVLAALRQRGDKGVARFYGEVRFPEGFLDRLDEHYVVRTVEHPFVVFARRASATTRSAAPPPGRGATP